MCSVDMGATRSIFADSEIENAFTRQLDRNLRSEGEQSLVDLRCKRRRVRSNESVTFAM